MTGRVLDGRYRVDARIARGGMATVYRAHDLRLDRECAVKIMHTDLGDNHDFAARFVREAHAAARLAHPNVVSVTDQGDDDGLLFLVMEHVPGRTLREVIREEAPLPPAQALALLDPILQALAEAHRCGLVHRDVKPENVLIADDGRVKVADFGLARAFDADSHHTATAGLLMGTVSYLAPELIVDGRADPRSDVYAAGVLLFELLTGQKPHQGEGAIQIAFKHVNEDVPAPSSTADHPIPAYVDALVLRATARDRDRRPADAKVLLHQVRRVRAAVESGDLEDPELTADLLPTVPLPILESIDYTAEDEAGSPDAAADDDSDDRDDSEEVTTIIGPAVTPRVVDAVAPADASALTPSAAPPPIPRGRTATLPRPSPGPPPRSGGPAPPPPRKPVAGADARSGASGSSGRSGGATAVRLRPGRGPLLLVLAVLLTALVAYAGWWFGIGRYTSTPGVINLPVSAATGRAETAGLTLHVQERAFSETVTAGSVISSDPIAGSRILEGGTVDVVVSKGPERYAVPRLRNKPLSDAQALLAEQHLEARTAAESWDEKVPEGAVISASPAAGTELRRGSTVDLVVSKGREPIKIPDLTGKSGERAQERLTELEFEVEVSEEHSDEVPKGRVISQNPVKGTGHRGDTIRIVVSKGPVMVAVPSLGTMSVQDATQTLEDVGLRVAVMRTEFYVGLDRVVRQSPKSGDSIPKGSTVTVYVV